MGLTPISVTNNIDSLSTDIRLFTLNDEFTLEYDDKVLLRFTPASAIFIPSLASNYEYIRDTAIVNIIDKDCKCLCTMNVYLHN